MLLRLAGVHFGLLFLGGCLQSDEGREPLVVFAASSLMEAFTELEEVFENEHPQHDLRLSVSGSQVLRLQVEHGAPADLIATANLQHLESLMSDGLVGPLQRFATNRLAVILPEEGARSAQDFEDLPLLERIVLGNPSVPVGAYAQDMLMRCGESFAAGVLAKVVSFEDSARLVRAKVEMGEADAAVVYESDALSGRGLRTLSIPERCNVSVEYGVSTTVSAKNREGAALFRSVIGSERGLAVLQNHGLGEVL